MGSSFFLCLEEGNMNERALFVIEEYMYDLFEPGKNWPEYEFRKRSYQRWAAEELSKCIRKHPNESVLKTVEDFVRKTKEYSEIDHDDRNDSFIFQVACDVTTDILDILRAMS